MKSLELIFDDVPMSNNNYLKLSAIKRSGRRYIFPRVKGLTLNQYKDKWYWLVNIAIKDLPRRYTKEDSMFKRGVLIKPEIWKQGKPYDPDNFWGGMKPVIDILVKVGIFPDDNPTYLRMQDPVWHHSKTKKMILTIEAMK